MVRCCCLHVFDAVTCNLYSLLAGQSEGLCCAIRQRGWFRAETARVIRSVAHSFAYIQRLDIKPVYTAEIAVNIPTARKRRQETSRRE